MNHIICISSSGSDDDVSKQESKHIFRNKSHKNKLQVPQKRKLSLNLSKDESSKKCKIQENNMVVLNTKNCNEIFSNKTIEDIKNENFLSTNSENNNLTDISSTSKFETSVELHQLKNMPIKKTETNKQSYSSQLSPTIRKVIKPQLVIKEKVPIPDIRDNMFLKFIETCTKTREDDVTRKILDKIKKRYNKITNINVNNKGFSLFLNGIINKILNNHKEKFYTYIQEVNDELKRINESEKTDKNNLNKANFRSNHTNIDEQIIFKDGKELSEDDMQKVIKLEKAIGKCQKRIRTLETQEVNFDDEEDSIYLQEDRFKRKLIELCALLSDIVGDKDIKREIYKRRIRLKDISDKMTGISVIDEEIINFVNTNINKINKLKHIKKYTAIADYLPMPDYEDILQCIYKCNSVKKLKIDKTKMEELAQSSFQSIVKYLKTQRILETKNYISSYGDNEDDPALKNNELNKILQQNKKNGDKKLEDIFQKYEKKEEAILKDKKQQTLESPTSNNENNNEVKKSENDEKEVNIFDKDRQSEEKEIGSAEKETLHQEKEEDKTDKDNKDICQLNNNSELQNTCDRVESNKEKEESKNIADKDVSCQNDNLLKNNQDEKTSIDSSVCNNISNVNSDSTINNSKNDCENPENCKKPERHEIIEILSDEDEMSLNNKFKENTNENTMLKNDAADIRLQSLVQTEETAVELNTEQISKEVNISQINNKVNLISVSANDQNETLENSKNKNEINLSKTNDKGNKSATIIKNNELKDDTTSKTTIIVNTPLEAKNADVKSSLIENSKDILQAENDNTSTPDNKITEISITPDVDTKKRCVPIENCTESIEIMEIVEEIEFSDICKESTNNIPETEITEDLKGFDIKSRNKIAPEEISSFIKVRSFAKPPDSWKDSVTPEKIKQNAMVPAQQVLNNLPNPEYVDLTAEKDRLPSTSTRTINSLANSNSRIPVKNLVLVNKVISNCRIPLSQKEIEEAKVTSARNVCVIEPPIRKSITCIPKPPRVLLNHTPVNNLNESPNALSTNVITRPYTVVFEKQNNP